MSEPLSVWIFPSTNRSPTQTASFLAPNAPQMWGQRVGDFDVLAWRRREVTNEAAT